MMTTWKLLYENSFPKLAETLGTTFEVFRAAQGSQSVQSGPVFMRFTGFGGFGIGRGRNITYRPSTELQNVIGIEVSMELGLLYLVEGQPLKLFTTEASGLSATLSRSEPEKTRLTVQLDSSIITIDDLKLRPIFQHGMDRQRLVIRWSTNGQVHVFLDGHLVAYENAVSVGHRFNLGKLKNLKAFGGNCGIK